MVETIVVYAVIAVMAGLAVWWVVGNLRGKSTGCGCDGCGQSGRCSLEDTSASRKGRGDGRA